MGNKLLIAAQDARDACEGEKDLLERIKKAMHATKDHWLVTDYQDRFNAALAGVMMESPDKDKERITEEVNLMHTLNWALRHCDALRISELQISEAPLHLARTWREIAAP